MTAFSEADVQNVRDGVELNVRLWPKADINLQQIFTLSLRGCVQVFQKPFEALRKLSVQRKATYDLPE